MPTSYPKSSPTEMLGLLVLLNSHKGSEDVALLADDLDLEIDEILPSLEFSEILGLVRVADGRATFTDLGRQFMGASIRNRKAILRDQLRRTTLFKTLLQALESAPGRSLTDEQLARIISFTVVPTDDAVANIVNWGRYAELVRYDAEEHRMVAAEPRVSAPTTAADNRRSPPTMPQPPPGSSASRKKTASTSNAESTTATLAFVAT